MPLSIKNLSSRIAAIREALNEPKAIA